MPSRRVSHRLQKGVSGGFRLGGGEPESLAILVMLYELAYLVLSDWLATNLLS
jgi:hypothetical protein